MNIDNPEIIGTSLMSLTSLLGAYYLVLKIRDQLKEKPDPKLTYATREQMEKVRDEIDRIVSAFSQDLRVLRADIRQENRALTKYWLRAMNETRQMVSSNAQNISSLIAQCSSANQRISELSLKTDRMILKERNIK